MGQAPSGMRLKSISAIGSTRFPTKPTLNSRPPMYSWTSTSSNCSVMAARRARSDLRSLTTEPRSSPALASSAAGLTMAGRGKSSSILPCATVQRGMASPACWSNAFAMGLRRHAARVQRLAPVMGIPANSSVPTTCSSHSLFPWTPSHRLNTRSARRATWNQRMSWRTPTLRISWPIEAKIAPISSTAFITPRMSSGVQSSAPGSNRMTTFTRPPPPAAGPVPRGGSPRRPSAPVPSAGARRYGPLPGSARRSRTRPRAPPWGSRSSWPDQEGRPAGGALPQCRDVRAQVAGEHTLSRSLRDRLDEHGVGQRHALDLSRRLDAGERRRGNTTVRQRLLGPTLVQRQRQRERVRACVRDVHVLADRRDERFAALAVEPFGHVENEIGASEDEVLRKELVGFESDDAAEETESLLDRSDGRRIVPFRKRVTGTVGRCVGRGIGFFVVCETDSHVVSGDLLQKRPLVRSVNQNALSSRQ